MKQNNINKEKSIPKFNRIRFANVEYALDIVTTLKKLSLYFTHEKITLVTIICIVTLGAVLHVTAPQLQSMTIDLLIAHKSVDGIEFLIFMFLAYFGFSITQLYQGILGAKLSKNIIKNLRNKLFSKILNLPLNYLAQSHQGDLMSRMTNDIELLSMSISQSFASFISGVLNLIFISTMMFYLCWQMTLINVVPLILVIFCLKFIAKKVKKSSVIRQQELGRLQSCIEESITNIITVQAYNHQELTKQEFSDISAKLTSANITTDSIAYAMGPLMNFFHHLSFLICVISGSYFYLNNTITLGCISAFIVYIKEFGKPLNEIAQIYGQIQTSLAAAERIFKILDEKEEIKTGEKLILNDAAEIEFKDVSFSYDGKTTVINNFNLHIHQGEKIAIVGETGSGKTTLINLLLRFYEISKGAIYINKKSIKDFSSTSLRKNIAVVLQDITLFSDSIYNNICYANHCSKKVEEAIKLCHCDELIKNNLSIENLSQGQRQLIAFARALATDAKILILDEATSNIDITTEQYLQDATQTLTHKKTCIIIAHRLSTIKNADCIVVFDKGKIIEQGTHSELLKLKGKYYELYLAANY